MALGCHCVPSVIWSLARGFWQGEGGSHSNKPEKSLHFFKSPYIFFTIKLIKPILFPSSREQGEPTLGVAAFKAGL